MPNLPIDSSSWTGRVEPSPPVTPLRERPRFQDDLARLADEHGIEFASKVAASYNAIWSPSR